MANDDTGSASSSALGILGVPNGGTGANLSATGGTSQVLQQTTVGGAVTVGVPGVTSVTGTLPVANGGTGATTASAARTSLGLGSIATQAASAVAITGGAVSGITDLAVADGGTGSSTAADARTALGLGTMATQASGAVAVTGGTVTGITDLAVADGGTGSSTASAARTALGLAIGTDVQAWDADLDALAASGAGSAWLTPTYAGTDFTASGSMTWTVASGDRTTLASVVSGKEMTVAWVLDSTTVAGTPSTQLKILIPQGKTATKTVVGVHYYSDNGTAGVGKCFVTAGQTSISLQILSGGNWAASTDNTVSQGVLTFEIN